mmetsp:Transcript_75065/g.132658  ORF Transcript_75065/g.132658 Transcript_75065/m.132658 type:complete len:93 (+) Transcript_75065:662-940(+)
MDPSCGPGLPPVNPVGSRPEEQCGIVDGVRSQGILGLRMCLCVCTKTTAPEQWLHLGDPSTAHTACQAIKLKWPVLPAAVSGSHLSCVATLG